MSTDPVKAAQEIENQRSRDRVQLIKDLKAAVDADAEIGDVEASLKRAISYLPSSVDGAAQNALAAVEELRKSTRDAVSQQRRAARDAGWANTQLAELGLAKPKSKRRTASKSSSSTSNSGGAAPAVSGVDVAGGDVHSESTVTS